MAFIVSIGGLLLGISANVSGASEFYRTYFNLKTGSFLEGFGVSIAMLSTFIGTFNAGILSDKIGRKRSLLLAAFLFSFCTLGSGLATSFTFFLISRFIGGLGIGISLVVVPMFIAEFSPSDKRGFLVSFYQLNIGIGFLLAYVLNSIVISQIADTAIVWRWMLGVGVIFPVIYFILLLFVPESPRWLIINGKVEKAKKLMVKMGGEAFAENEFAQIKQSASQSGAQEKSSYKNSWKLLFSNKMRLVVLVAFSVAFFQMASGFNSVMFFAPKIFRLAGFSGTGSFLQSNLIGITMVVMTIVSMLLIDRLGRRPLLLIGVSLMAVSLLISTVAFNQAKYVLHNSDIAKVAGEGTPESAFVAEILRPYTEKVYSGETTFFHQFRNDILIKTRALVEQKQSDPNALVAFGSTITGGFSKNKSSGEIVNELSGSVYSDYKDKLLDVTISIQSMLVMISILCFVIGFSISLGPITWALLSEVFPAQVRGLGISIASTLNGITSFVVVTILPIELEYLGSSTTFLIYGILMLIFIVMVIKWFPETKGKSLEEIEAELVK
jgi:MFS family permease